MCPVGFRVGFLALLVWACVAWMYWPGHAGPVLLDDRSSVEVLDVVESDPDFALDEIFANQSGPLGRPVSIATFVIERLLLGSEISISKLANIGLHLFNGALVFWLFNILFRWIGIQKPAGFALILSVIWLVAPMNVSTVLYTVQRMAMLAATFMFLAIISYAYWRIAYFNNCKTKWLGAVFVVFFALLGVYSKENAVTVVPILLLLEALWFQSRSDYRHAPRRSHARMVLALILVGFIGVIIFLSLGWEWLEAGYDRRHFDIWERLFTEGRVLWDYVFQWLLPDVNRMGLYHDDVILSRSLTDPRTTLYSILGWASVLIIIAILACLEWGRYIAFGLLWFLVAHFPESSVLSLELYFEHRNYFPAVGLILSLGVSFALVARKWPQTTKPLVVWLSIYSLWLVMQTSSQVQIWSNRSMLVLNHLAYHPESFRANTDMAVLLAGIGAVDSARAFSGRAFEFSAGERNDDRRVRDLALNCIANRSNESDLVEEIGSESRVRPLSSVTTLHTLVRMLQDGRCPNFDQELFADKMAEIYLQDARESQAAANIYASLAVLENSIGRYENAHAYMERYLLDKPDESRGLLMQLHFSTALGRVDEANELAKILEKKKASGDLSVEEEQTLSLYTEQ